MKELYVRHVAALLVVTSVVVSAASAKGQSSFSRLDEISSTGRVITDTPKNRPMGRIIAENLFLLLEANDEKKGDCNQVINMRVVAQTILDYCLSQSEQDNLMFSTPEADHHWSMFKVNYGILASCYYHTQDGSAFKIKQSQSLNELHGIFLRELDVNQQENIEKLFSLFSQALELVLQ